MVKTPLRYLSIDPWVVTEEGFHPEQGRVSESIFALGNEYMGVRGYFEEGYSGDRLVGSYFNGLYDERPNVHLVTHRGMSTRMCFMVNAVDWLYTRLRLDGETLDIASSAFTEFTRTLDLRTGILMRSLVWQTASGKALKLTFTRFVSMAVHNLGGQRITLEPLNFSGAVEVTMGLDFSRPHENYGNRNVWRVVQQGDEDGIVAIQAQTETSHLQAFSSFRVQADKPIAPQSITGEQFIGVTFTVAVEQGVAANVEKLVVNYAEKMPDADPNAVWAQGLARARQYSSTTFEAALEAHCAYWHDVWQALDVTIDGDPENQQGVRFCIFQMHQTYHGGDPTLNVGAKGLTGEAYEGATYWDTETYCLPFYLFNNPQAAKHLILYRYHTLPQALARAVEQDCRGACYPFATIDGTESNGMWQHGNLEIHVSAAVAYAVWHYATITGDTDLLYREGIEMLLQICRYFASRGGWSPRTGEFGFYGVMGADEYHMMVNNNAYTNVMVQKMFRYTLAVMAEMRANVPEQLQAAIAKVQLDPAESADWQRMAEMMCVLQDPETGVYEQHQGYFDLPHVDFSKETQFPLIKYWAYDRIYRYDMIKQPDVLLLHFFFSHDYTLENKRANYEYYEPRCIHESSLSPGIHAILAAELGLHADAYRFSHYATRLDLDNYNRNTHEGLHTTSMAAAWMNIVYGFGGMRSDREVLSFNPSLPYRWQGFSLRIRYRASIMQVSVSREQILLTVVDGPTVRVEVFGQRYTVGTTGIAIPMPRERIGDAPLKVTV